MIISKFLRFLKNPKAYIETFSSFFYKKNKGKLKEQAKEFFKRKKLLKFFESGESEEINPNYLDLKYLYETIIFRKPKCILEFGVGFSTISILLALEENSKLRNFGRLHVLDSEKRWIRNTKKKIPKHLKKFVIFEYSQAKVDYFQGQLVSTFEKLPNISPNLILLDGPNPKSIKGEMKGLNFSDGRAVVAADILYYESTSPNNFLIIVDGRYNNAMFLKNNLKNKYKFRQNLACKRFTFEKIS